jgi:hypothetical protein
LPSSDRATVARPSLMEALVRQRPRSVVGSRLREVSTERFPGGERAGALSFKGSTSTDEVNRALQSCVGVSKYGRPYPSVQLGLDYGDLVTSNPIILCLECTPRPRNFNLDFTTRWSSGTTQISVASSQAIDHTVCKAESHASADLSTTVHETSSLSGRSQVLDPQPSLARPPWPIAFQPISQTGHA